jgi:hypothetical protein
MMETGTLSQKKTLSSVLSKAQVAWWEALLLFGLGATAVLLHQALRAPLNLPGRHGLEWMALLILGRALSRSRVAGSITSVGAATFSVLPIWGAVHDPFIWLIYLVPGLLMDFVFAKLPGMTGKLWFLALLGSLAHATKPLIRLVITLITGFPFGSLLYGILYPLGSHLLFGLLGGLLGGLLALGVQKSVKKP